MEETMKVPMEEIGKVTHYFTNVGVAVVKLSKSLKVGDKIKIEGATTNFEQEVKSIEIEGEKVKKVKVGDDIGLKVIDRVREGDTVYKVS